MDVFSFSIDHVPPEGQSDQKWMQNINFLKAMQNTQYKPQNMAKNTKLEALKMNVK